MADLPRDLSWCVVPTLDVVGAQMDCARTDRIPVQSSLGTGVSGDRGSLVREVPASTTGDGEDWRDVAISASNDEVYPEQFLLNQKAYLDRLCALHHHGLSLANVLVLIRTWSQGASIHILRHVVVTKEWAALVDAQLTAALEHLQIP